MQQIVIKFVISRVVKWSIFVVLLKFNLDIHQTEATSKLNLSSKQSVIKFTIADVLIWSHLVVLPKCDLDVQEYWPDY
jgi:hypothetical protein